MINFKLEICLFGWVIVFLVIGFLLMILFLLIFREILYFDRVLFLWSFMKFGVGFIWIIVEGVYLEGVIEK